MSIFESKYYGTVMYISISIVLILILFNFVNIFEDINKIKQSKDSDIGLTGYSIQPSQDRQFSFSNFLPKIYYFSFIIILIIIILKIAAKIKWKYFFEKRFS